MSFSKVLWQRKGARGALVILESYAIQPRSLAVSAMPIRDEESEGE